MPFLIASTGLNWALTVPMKDSTPLRSILSNPPNTPLIFSKDALTDSAALLKTSFILAKALSTSFPTSLVSLSINKNVPISPANSRIPLLAGVKYLTKPRTLRTTAANALPTILTTENIPLNIRVTLRPASLLSLNVLTSSNSFLEKSTSILPVTGENTFLKALVTGMIKVFRFLKAVPRASIIASRPPLAFQNFNVSLRASAIPPINPPTTSLTLVNRFLPSSKSPNNNSQV